MKRKKKFKPHEIKVKTGNRALKTFVSMIGPYQPYLKRNKLLGGYVPTRVYNFFSLLAIMHRVSISELLKTIVFDFIEKYNEEDVLSQLCQETLDSWIETVEENDGKVAWSQDKLQERWKAYKADLIKVHLKILPDYYLKQIIKYIEEARF